MIPIPVKTAEPGRTINPEKWADCYAEYLLAFALRLLKDRQKSEDMVQDTFLKALKKIDSFKGASSELTWLTAILKNNIYDLLKRDSKQGRLSDISYAGNQEDEYFEENGYWKNGAKPEFWHSEKMDSIERTELFKIFEHCLSRLPVQWASVFTMKHLDDEKSENICGELNISAPNLWTIMHRAKLKLRSCMEKLWLNR